MLVGYAGLPKLFNFPTAKAGNTTHSTFGSATVVSLTYTYKKGCLFGQPFLQIFVGVLLSNALQALHHHKHKKC